MEVGAHVWLRSPSSQWGWVPARIVDREEEITNNNNKAGGKSKPRVKLTLKDDTGSSSSSSSIVRATSSTRVPRAGASAIITADQYDGMAQRRAAEWREIDLFNFLWKFSPSLGHSLW
mmetsp:Transcript_3893/g.8733  ORF Transcript_3893/g.8733 Transcript_3893/m.8733 type:complete len:118 (-) Transcript_3893:1971-2324(-)